MVAGRRSSTRRSRDWAEKLAAKSPVMMKLGKDAMFRQQDMAFADALDFLRSQLTIAFSTEDIQEGVKAFFEKREPEWNGALVEAAVRCRERRKPRRTPSRSTRQTRGHGPPAVDALNTRPAPVSPSPTRLSVGSVRALGGQTQNAAAAC